MKKGQPSPTRLDVTGHRFGNWTAIRHNGRKQRQTYWLCRCDCGTVRSVQIGALLNGRSKRCSTKGCTVHAQLTHGLSKTRIYGNWNKMIERCHNPRCPGFPNYGGRGIRVCKRWRDSFEAFCADVGPKPSPRHSLERINNDGDYKPSNVRWATPKEQLRNTRINKRLTFRGETLTQVEWIERLGLTKSALQGRWKHGWSVERALSTPVRSKRPNGMGRRDGRHVA